MGRICEQKGQLLLIEAAQRLAAQGAEFELVLVGDGEMRGDIEALIKRYMLQANGAHHRPESAASSYTTKSLPHERSFYRALPRAFPWSSWRPWR